MDDPTNWNTDAFEKGIGTFENAAMAHEVAKRCNAYPGLVDALRNIRKRMAGSDIEHAWINWPIEPSIGLGQSIDNLLRELGEDK